MKNPLLVLSLGVFCLVLPTRYVLAQSGFNPGAGGSNPFGRVYNPPSNPPAAPPANANVPGASGTLNTAVPPAMMYSSEPVEPNHKLNRGDVLNFQVAEERDPKYHDGQLTVLDSGDVNMPLGGLVPAAGKTVAQLTSDVRTRLERDYYYHATVVMGLSQEARRPSRGRVYVTGAIRIEGSVELPLDEPLTVSQAIIKSGGLKDFGSSKVKLLRKNNPGRPLVVDIRDVRRGKMDNDQTLKPGDTIFVPEKILNFN